MNPINNSKPSIPPLSQNLALTVKSENALVNVGGKKVPVSTPEPGKKPPQKVKPPDIHKAVQQIQSFLADSQRNLHFRVDQNSGRMIITVVNPETKETIRQIPPEEVLALIAMMEQQGPHFIVDEA